MREARWLALRIPPLAREPQEFLRILEIWLYGHLSPGIPQGPPLGGHSLVHGLLGASHGERVGSASSGAALHWAGAGLGWLWLASAGLLLKISDGFQVDFGGIWASAGFGFGWIWLDLA